jgi:hypothetical protein
MLLQIGPNPLVIYCLSAAFAAHARLSAGTSIRIQDLQLVSPGKSFAGTGRNLGVLRSIVCRESLLRGIGLGRP